MKQKILFTLLLTAFATLSAFAQKSMLVAYNGGYFVKNDKEWSEYRPADSAGRWSSYKQYKESEEFFYLKNKKCRVAIPKIAKDKIFIDREKEGKWEVVYTPLNIYTLCPESEGVFYCYTAGDIASRGYFVRDNNIWREYRPLMKRSKWAEFKQCDENKNFFIVESKHNTVYIPKSNDKNFIIKKKDNSSWQGGYTTTAIYDRSAKYRYNFYFQQTLTAKRKKFEESGENARVSFDNKNNLVIAVDGKHYYFTYTSIEISELGGKEAILITIDKKNRLYLTDSNTCNVECKEIGKNRLFIGGDSKLYNQLKAALLSGTFCL